MTTVEYRRDNLRLWMRTNARAGLTVDEISRKATSSDFDGTRRPLYPGDPWPAHDRCAADLRVLLKAELVTRERTTRNGNRCFVWRAVPTC